MTADDNKIIVALGREYGSGGLEIATLLAERLDIPFYDKKLISMASGESGLSGRLLNMVDEHAMSVYIEASTEAAKALTGQNGKKRAMSLNDHLYEAQESVLHSIASLGSCIIVGRTADYVLRDDPALISVFVHANMAFRIGRIARSNGISVEDAAAEIRATDKQRKEYYKTYTGRKWGHIGNYNMTIDSSVLDIDGTADQLFTFIRHVMERRASR